MLKKRVLTKSFFDRPTLKVAQELLGKFLVCKIGRKAMSGMITEIEAYIGLKDQASHASRLWRGSLRAARGKTPRTEVMFGKPGYWYVYLIYGMHYCLNVVTEREGYPAAILIRSVDHTAGPGRVCKRFRIDKALNKRPIAKSSGLWIEDRGIKVPVKDIKSGPRIGVDYAGVWKSKPCRFYL